MKATARRLSDLIAQSRESDEVRKAPQDSKADLQKQLDTLKQRIGELEKSLKEKVDGRVRTLKRLKDALAEVGAGRTAIEGHNA